MLGAVSLLGLRVSLRPSLASLPGPVPTLLGTAGAYYSFEKPQPLPAILFVDSQNRQRRIGDLGARIVLLNFWATWCAPCIAELPALDRLQAAYSPDDFAVLALCTDLSSPTAVMIYMSNRGIRNLRAYLDPGGRAVHECAIPALPTSFILDRRGTILGMLPGAAEWDSAAARALVSYYVASSARNS